MSEQPENVDNPATPDVDVDQPQNPNDPGAFVNQEEPADAAADTEPAQEGEPVVEPATVDPDSDEAQNDPGDDLAPADDAGAGEDFTEPDDGTQDDGA